jgi:hypothetical protein
VNEGQQNQQPNNPKMRTPPDFELKPDFGIRDLKKKHSYIPFFTTILSLMMLAGIALLFINIVILKDIGKDDFGNKICTSEAKVCPDGSYVGRSGPNCNFKECPTAQDATNNIPNDWQTYRNEEFGFEFRYPEDWELFTNVHGSTADLLISIDSIGVSHVDNDLPYNFEIEVYKDISGIDYYYADGQYHKYGLKNLNEYLEKFSSGEDPRLTNILNFTIGGNSGFKADAGPNVFGGGKFYYVENSSVIYEFRDHWEDKSLQILSTFKFIE